MIRVVPFALLLAVCVAHATASLAERTQVALLRVEVRADQSEQFEKILNEHYERSTAMIRREVRTAPEDVDKRVPRLLRTISKDTLKHMSKVLDAKQMEAFEYALDLENRRFMQSNGVHEP
ncbi:MAG TPA: hypothetical protein VL379_20155 [Pseudomonadales bacterium]|jgi:hypothetical protein|nr:hypothetical protein [Pseudomonadales bacterium]